MTVDKVLALLERHGCRPRRAGAGWVARCPAHDDRKPSLSVSQGRDGQILLHCFSGCTLESILAALGLRWSDLFPDDPLRRRDYRPSGPGPLPYDLQNRRPTSSSMSNLVGFPLTIRD